MSVWQEFNFPWDKQVWFDSAGQYCVEKNSTIWSCSLPHDVMKRITELIAFVKGIHRWLVDSAHKWPVVRRGKSMLATWRTKSSVAGGLSLRDAMWSHCLDDVINWKHFPRYWPFVRGIHRSPVNSPHKGQWRGALMFPLICVWINGWVNNREAGDLRRYRAHYDVTVMVTCIRKQTFGRTVWIS